MAVPALANTQAVPLVGRVDALERAQRTTRRESVATLVPDADTLVASAANDLRIARNVLKYLETDPSRPDLTEERGKVAAAETLHSRARALRDSIAAEAEPVEVRQASNAGICGVYNQATGKVDWKTLPLAGVAGLYNPARRAVDWFTATNQGIAVVRNPETGAPVDRRNHNGGIAGVVDPATNRPRFELGQREGVALVIDPLTNQLVVERAPGNAIVGYLDPQTHAPQFRTAPVAGMAVVYRDGTTYRSSCSYVPDPPPDTTVLQASR